MMKWLILTCMLILVLCGARAVAEDCIDIRLAAGIVPGEPNHILRLGFYALNCGTEPGIATCRVYVGVDSKSLGSAMFKVRMPAAEPLERRLGLPIPPGTPPGMYTLCLTADLGTASDTTCATVTIDGEGQVLGFRPHDSTAGGVSTWSWGEIKAGYK
jgi:hypothetical protein